MLTMSFSAASAQISKAEWGQIALTTNPSGPGCSSISYPSTTWTSTDCTNPPSGATTVGNGHDNYASSGSTKIGQVDGFVNSMTGFNGESDNESGTNHYSLQTNSQEFGTTYGGNSVTGWEQFIYNGNGASQNGSVWIEFWLIGYGTCPGTAPNSYVGVWQQSGSNCYANSDGRSTDIELPSNLAHIESEGIAATSGTGNDISKLCDFNLSTCWSISIPQVLNLYLHWTQVEWGVFGYDNGSRALFTSPVPTLDIEVHLWDGSGTQITPTCNSGGFTGFTGETNNLNLGSCSVSGSMDYSES